MSYRDSNWYADKTYDLDSYQYHNQCQSYPPKCQYVEIEKFEDLKKVMVSKTITKSCARKGVNRVQKI